MRSGASQIVSSPRSRRFIPVLDQSGEIPAGTSGAEWATPTRADAAPLSDGRPSRVAEAGCAARRPCAVPGRPGGRSGSPGSTSRMRSCSRRTGSRRRAPSGPVPGLPFGSMRHPRRPDLVATTLELPADGLPQVSLVEDQPQRPVALEVALPELVRTQHAVDVLVGEAQVYPRTAQRGVRFEGRGMGRSFRVFGGTVVRLRVSSMNSRTDQKLAHRFPSVNLPDPAAWRTRPRRSARCGSRQGRRQRLSAAVLRDRPGGRAASRARRRAARARRAPRGCPRP